MNIIRLIIVGICLISANGSICRAEQDQPKSPPRSELLFSLRDLPVKPMPDPKFSDDGLTLEFDDRQWVAKQLIKPLFFRPMKAVDYRLSTDSQIRLVVMVNDKDLPESARDHVFSAMHVEQIFKNGKWIQHGITAEWMIRGNYGFSHYNNGVALGNQYEFHSNGKIHIIREHKPQNVRKKECGWWDNGQLQYQSISQNNKEIEGRFWEKDGTLSKK